MSETIGQQPHQSESKMLQFPVVGVGASAGGLEALTALVRALPDRPGFALVVVQHLDPTQPSSLADLLAREAKLPVREVEHNMPVAVDQVYIIPPTADLLIQSGVFHLLPRPAARTPHFPIDVFFRSLAEERGELAVGVILSGTGSDGTLGLKAIRSAGGPTFAQDETAQYDSMPRNAITAGCVDTVLPPEGIAAALIQLSREPKSVSEPLSTEPDVLTALLRMVRKATGVDFATYKSGTVSRRILRRMSIQKLERLAEYAKFVEANPVEARALFEDMLIHVTSFFRDPDTFEALRSEVFLALLADRPVDSPIRVWVPGCSTGEELYSLAISWLEFLGDKSVPSIKLFGTDLSDVALETARSGKYPASIAADVSPERLRRFFVTADGGYQISRAVRDLCVFARHDVTRDPPFSNMDIVSCRNVLIYLCNDAQNRVLPIFHYALKPTGYLLLGTSETVNLFTDLFTALNQKHRIYARKGVATRGIIDFTSSTFALQSIQAGQRQQTTKSSDALLEADNLVLARFAPPGVVVNESLEVLQFRGDTGPYLELSPGLASLGLLKLARGTLQVMLRTAIEEVRSVNTQVRKDGLRYEAAGRTHVVNLIVTPYTVPPGTQRYYLILFEALTPSPGATSGDLSGDGSTPELLTATQVAQLREELTTTRTTLQSTVEDLEVHNEELQAANEEVISSNEELRSTNEELQTAKEELQATNEELGSVNEELKRRIEVSAQLGNDLTNLLSSVEIPIVMVGNDIRVRRFTPSASKLFNLLPADIGRPLNNIRSRLNAPDLEQQLTDVIDTMAVKECEVCDRDGRWYRLCIRPYRTLDNKIDGAVLTVVDIDALKRSEQLITSARDYANAIVETVSHPLIILNDTMRVVSANAAFYSTFRVTMEETANRFLYQLGEGQWDIPELRALLNDILPSNTVIKNYEVIRIFPKIGRRIMHLNGLRMVNPLPHVDGHILLAIEDITDRKKAEMEVHTREARFRAILEAATEAIITIDVHGVIESVNPATERIFGYPPAELVGQSVKVLMPAPFRDECDNYLAQYLKTGVKKIIEISREVQGRRKDGTIFPVDLTVTEVFDGQRWFIGIIRDITQRKELERQVVESVMEEERRIGRDLHDGIGQELTGLGLLADALAQRLPERSGGEDQLARKIVDGLHRVHQHLRSMCRELVLEQLDAQSLRATLENLAARTCEQSGVSCTCDCHELVNVPNLTTAKHLYRIAQEAVTNALRHGHPEHIVIKLHQVPHGIQLSIEDDGTGNADEAVNGWEGKGLGITTMRYRATTMGGTLQIGRKEDKGVVVTCTVPLEESNAAKE